MDLVDAHAARLPALDDRWVPRLHERAALVRGLLEGRAAGPEVSHPMDNVRRNIGLLLDGDPDKQFGMSGLAGSASAEEVLALVGEAAGFDARTAPATGPVPVDPERVLDACAEVGERLALACERRERVVLATGHPVGLMLLYAEVGRALAARGVELLRPGDGERWTAPGSERPSEIRYLWGVGMRTDGTQATHTHEGEPMRRMLAHERPDLVLADHGFAGRAIEEGVEALSVADVNDPALLLARAQGRTASVIVMDDNVRPDAYWPCFQEIVARLPRAPGSERPTLRGRRIAS